MNWSEWSALAGAHINATLASPMQMAAYAAAAIAAALVVAGAFVRTMIPLRWLAVGSNVGFVIFGLLYPAPVTLLVAGVLLPINIYRAIEMMRLTQQVRRAAVASDQSGVWLKPYMKAKKYRAGQVLFRRGDRAECLFMVAKGRIEMVEIAKEIEPGRIFGEIALFAPDKRRTHTARCVVATTVLSIDEGTVNQLFFQNPAFGFHLIGLVAGRLLSDVQRLERHD